MLDRVLVPELIRAGAAPLGDMQRVAVPVTVTIEPRLISR